MLESLVQIVGFFFFWGGGNISVIDSKNKENCNFGTLGSDEKDYQFLLKGGEILHQDMGLMKIFKNMSDGLAQNAKTKSSNLSLQIYDGILITLKLGLIEWAPDTTTYQCIYEPVCSKLKMDSAKRAMRDTIMKFFSGKDSTRFFLLWTCNSQSASKRQFNLAAPIILQRQTIKLNKAGSGPRILNKRKSLNLFNKVNLVSLSSESRAPDKS